MKKRAKELKKGDKVLLMGKTWTIKEIEISNIGKQGSSKCRLELENQGQTMVIIRPADYPFELK